MNSLARQTASQYRVNGPLQGTPSNRPISKRSARVPRWGETLRNSDVNRLWQELHRIVASHALVRAARGTELLIEEGASSLYTDLTQELFVQLLTKSRFQHYLDTGMTDAEIECEIGQIELTNMLTADLRKRHPESYRLARRISTLIQSSAKFRRFDRNSGDEQQYRRLTDRVYGLNQWPAGKRTRSFGEMEERAHMVPMRQRDIRKVGCTGDAQIVISNADLQDLIVSVANAIDSPADIRTLRILILSRLPVMDMHLVPLSNGEAESDGPWSDPPDSRKNPEEGLMCDEAEREAAESVAIFLDNMSKNVRGKLKQYRRILAVLWHCYLSPNHPTQLEVSFMLGVSDSLVSDYRRRIEQELSALSLKEVEDARIFELALRERVRTLITAGGQASFAHRAAKSER
jgi:hypothetical protein